MSQVFYTLDMRPNARVPIWMFSDRLELHPAAATGWVHLPVEIMHPKTAPAKLAREYVAVFHQTGEPDSLLHSAVANGVFLNMKQLRLAQVHLKYKMCDPGKGHGKNGRIVKRDWCQGLIDHLFPEASAADKLQMLRGLMGQTWVHLDPKVASKHTKDILSAFHGLPSEDQSTFVELAAVASDEILLQEKRDQKARVQAAPKKERMHETPITLRDLCPRVAGSRLTRHPVLKRYQAFYPEFNEKGSLFLILKPHFLFFSS